MKINDYLNDPQGIEKLAEEITAKYNWFLDSVINHLDYDVVMKKFDEAKSFSFDLEELLKNTTAPKKWVFSNLISSITGQEKEKTKVMRIKDKADVIFGQYKECYTALKNSVQIQYDKWLQMEEALKEFEEIEKLITEQISSLAQDDIKWKIIYSSANSFLKNLKKMIITMKQKMSVMQWVIISSMWLKEEMASWMYHFESLIKDMLINISLDNIVKSAANIINSVRWIVEKYNDKMANSMIETAEDIADIRDNGIMSTEALTNMWVIINTASQKFQALTNKSKQHEAIMFKQLEVLQNWVNELNKSQENYLSLKTEDVKQN